MSVRLVIGLQCVRNGDLAARPSPLIRSKVHHYHDTVTGTANLTAAGQRTHRSMDRHPVVTARCQLPLSGRSQDVMPHTRAMCVVQTQ
jgi:hypothetical protein